MGERASGENKVTEVTPEGGQEVEMSVSHGLGPAEQGSLEFVSKMEEIQSRSEMWDC